MPMATTAYPTAVRLMKALWQSLPPLDAAERAFYEYEPRNDPWHPGFPHAYLELWDDGQDDEVTARCRVFEDAWDETWGIVKTLEAAGYPRRFSESRVRCVEMAGLQYVGEFDREIAFGPVVFYRWTMRVQGETQPGASNLVTTVADEAHGIPDAFFQRLRFERTASDAPQSHDAVRAWAALTRDGHGQGADETTAASGDSRERPG